MIPFIDLKSQYNAYKEEIDTQISEVLESTQFIGGPKVAALEQALADFCGTKYAIGVSSGTDALLVALMACGIGPDDEVITTPFTFVATAEAIVLLGAKPVFVDIEEQSYNIDVTKIKEAITKKTKAIIPVSLYGQPADMDEINTIAKKHGLVVIEDGCQSFGATYKGGRSCGLSAIGCTSFFPSKPLGCYGDGGAIFTSDESLYQKMRSIANHGQEGRYIHKHIGLNARLDALQAAVLLVKLEHFEQEINKRQEVAKRYDEGLDGLDLILPKIKRDRTSVYAQYSVRAKKRNDLTDTLKQEGIPTAIHYPTPLFAQEAFSRFGYRAEDFPISTAVSKEIFSLPMSPFLKSEDQKRVIDTLQRLLR